MPEPAISWNEVRGIHFSFGHHFGCDNKQWQLNTAFAQILPNIASLFIVDDDGVDTLRPDPIPVLKSLIVAAIVDELPASEVFKAHKQRIALLISNSAIFCHVKDHARSRVRDKRGLDKAARRTNNGDPIVRLVLTIFSWEFHKDWYPYDFHIVYDHGYGVPSYEAMLQRKTPSHTQRTNRQKFTNKLFEQFKRERNGETVQQALPPKRKHPKTTRPAAAISTFPVESKSHTAIKVPTYCVTSSSATTALPPVKPIDSDVVTTLSNPIKTTSDLLPGQATDSIPDTPAPSYTWTWKYSPNSDSVSFHRVQSNSISSQRSTSSSSSRVRCQEKSNTTPIQCQDKSTVTASHETPSTMPNSDHHSAPPLAPTNFSWTFNPQNEIATFRRLPKSAPSPSPQPPMHNRLLPSETLAEGTDLPNAAPAYIRSLQSPCLNPISSRPNHLPVLRLSKRHRDALKVNLYHLYANILSMNWFYDTFD
eukprot:jgi/Psemu1/46103/gm1.46103_g